MAHRVQLPCWSVGGCLLESVAPGIFAPRRDGQVRGATLSPHQAPAARCGYPAERGGSLDFPAGWDRSVSSQPAGKFGRLGSAG
jgi:hypothetical protein